jgi:Ca2+-binding RTX toxin-like protein
MIIIDASGATSGMDFEAFVRGGFVADQEGGGQPVWDNSNAFTGEELFFSYGTEAASTYVLAHGEGITYDFMGTHSVYGVANVLEFGTRGSGTFDSDGYFTGGNVELRISGLELGNAVGDYAGALHNFALAYMGMGGEDAFNAYADALDTDAQTFIGSDFDDVYSGTAFGDILKGGDGDDDLDGGAGADSLKGGRGEDLLTGGDGIDTFVFAALKQSPAKGGAGRDTITDFTPGEDLIDLSALKKPVDFIGSDAFSGDREVRYVVKEEKTVVSLDKNGDGHADLKFTIAAAVELSEGDFIL